MSTSTPYNGLYECIFAFDTGNTLTEKFAFGAQDSDTRVFVSCDFREEKLIFEAGVHPDTWARALQLLADPQTPRETIDACTPNMKVIAKVPVVRL